MQYTSAQAAKLLRKLGEEHQLLLNDEMNTCVFLAATGEDVDSLRPGYDYTATQQELAALEAKIRKVRHAINVFNSTTTIDGHDLCSGCDSPLFKKPGVDRYSQVIC